MSPRQAGTGIPDDLRRGPCGDARGRQAAWIASRILYLTLAAAACSPAGPRKTAAREAKKDARAPDEMVSAHRYRITCRLDPGSVGHFATLNDQQKRAVAALKGRPGISTEVMVLGGRVLVTVPKGHPAGAVELLLAEDLDSLTLFVPARKVQVSLPRDRLPDVLDGRVTSARSGFRLDFDPDGPPRIPRQGQGRRIRTTEIAARLALRYFPDPSRPASWLLRVKFNVLIPDQPPVFPFQQPLLHLALPLLQTDRGNLVLESLAARSGPPLAWTVRIANEGSRGGTPPTFHNVVEDLGTVLVSTARFEDRRRGYRQPGRRPAGRPGLQEITPSALAPLRATRVRGALEIHNSTAYAAFVHVDGVRLGWVGPRQRFSFKGLPSGYYRIYAVSPVGVRSWGPFDMFVPGPLTLR